MKKTGLSAFCVLILLLLGLAGCGGSGGSGGSGGDSSTPAATSVLLSGVVEDGPIENAKISLRDQENNILAVSPIMTDMTGAFSLQVPVGTLFAGLSVVAVDGRDRATGVDFTGLEMRSHLELFSDDASATVISPLTTLVAKLHEQGTPLVVAQDRLRAWLALPAATDLAVRPSASLDLQRRTLLLTKIALEIKAVATDSDPFSRIGTQMSVTETLDAVTANPGIMSALGLDVAAQARVQNLQMLLATASTVDNAIFLYKREELMGVFAANVEQMLLDSFDPLNASYRENLRHLTETTLQAAGSEVITLGGTIPQRIVRYILFTYKLRTWESLTLDPVVFASALNPLANDPWVAELARSRSLYSVVSPLQLAELPGNDNQQRLAYFYGADTSPHYLAEQLIGNVYDDFINDEILVQIVEGKANSGLIDEANTIIETQIMQREERAHAYRALANAFIAFNKFDEAILALNKAKSIYSEVLGSNYVANLVKTSNSYRKTGDLKAAEDLLAGIGSYLVTDSDFGNSIAGLQVLVDVYIAEGDFDKAGSQTQKMYEYSLKTPETAPGNYMLRVRDLSECAKRYADLNHPGMVLDIYNDIQALWDTYPKTLTSTWVYVPDLVETLYRSGEKEASLMLLNKIPITNKSGATLRRTIAYCKIATYEALHGNLETALSFADNVTINDGKIDLLTYFATNQSNPYIALSLINAERYDEARQVLAMVETLLVSEDITKSNNLIKIRYGYVRLSGLYALLGDRNKAKELLDIAQQVIGDDPYAVTVKIDVALGYINIGELETACTILESAKNSLITIPDNENPYQEDAPPPIRSMEEAKTRLYQKLAKTFIMAGEKESALEIVRKFVEWAKKINSENTVDDTLNRRKCDYLLSAATYFEDAGSHNEALASITVAIEVVNKIAIPEKRLDGYIAVTVAYAAIHEKKLASDQAKQIALTRERNKAFQSLAKYYINRDDFPDTWVASIDSDGDGKPDFFNPLASAAEIAASGLIMDDDSDGDGIVDTLDLRPLFAD